MKKKTAWDATKEQFKPVIKQFKSILGDRVGEVVLSIRLVETPCVVVTGRDKWSANMERIAKAQAMGNDTHNYMSGKKILEINPGHALVKSMLHNTNETEYRDIVEMMYESALISSGFSLMNPVSFSRKINTILMNQYCNDADQTNVFTDNTEDEPIAVLETDGDVEVDNIDNDEDSILSVNNEDEDSVSSDVCDRNTKPVVNADVGAITGADTEPDTEASTETV